MGGFKYQVQDDSLNPPMYYIKEKEINGNKYSYLRKSIRLPDERIKVIEKLLKINYICKTPSCLSFYVFRMIAYEAFFQFFLAL